MKHSKSSYSIFCCSISDIWSLVPPAPAFQCICGNAIYFVCDGLCESREACMCNNGSNEAFGEKLFNFLLFNFRYFVLCYFTSLRSLSFVTLQSMKAAMGCMGQEKLACAIRVEMKHFERSYSTLCCSISVILSSFTPPSIVHRHLW